jgi:DNA primase
LSLYHDFDEDVPESLIITRELLKMIEENDPQPADKPLSPIPEQILTYYILCVNDQFLSDHITYVTQHFFELGYDPSSNRITIPIRNYDGTLVGVKGRYFGDIPEGSEIQRYIYLEPCNKSQILYGLDKTKDKIEETHFAYVGESEKFVMQLWSYGDYNAVATGGKTISRQQIDLLSRLCDKVVLCLDSDVKEDELKNIADKFLGYVEVYMIVDENRLLVEKESPSDDPEKWKVLKNQLKRIK